MSLVFRQKSAEKRTQSEWLAGELFHTRGPATVACVTAEYSSGARFSKNLRKNLGKTWDKV